MKMKNTIVWEWKIQSFQNEKYKSFQNEKYKSFENESSTRGTKVLKYN